MIVFVHGEDSYSSRQYLEQLITEFKTKHADGDVRWFGDDVLWDEIAAGLASDSLFQSQTFVLLKNALDRTELREALAAYLENRGVSDNQTLVIYQTSPVDKRTSLVKRLLKEPGAREFPQVAPNQVEKFIATRFRAANKTIEPAAVRLLAAIVGADLWRAQAEADKLSALSNQVITVSDIKDNVRHGLDDDIWRFVDSIGLGNKKRALALLEQQWLSGAEPLYLLSMVVRQVRLLLALSQAPGSDAELAASLFLHPFVVQKTRQQARGLSVIRLAGIYQALVRLDAALKSGRGEPRLLFTVLLDSIMK